MRNSILIKVLAVAVLASLTLTSFNNQTTEAPVNENELLVQDNIESIENVMGSMDAVAYAELYNDIKE